MLAARWRPACVIVAAAEDPGLRPQISSRWEIRLIRCTASVQSYPRHRHWTVAPWLSAFAVTASDIRLARFFSNFKDGQFSHLVSPQPSPTWIVPTRR